MGRGDRLVIEDADFIGILTYRHQGGRRVPHQDHGIQPVLADRLYLLAGDWRGVSAYH
jgi:hypothetical protein